MTFQPYRPATIKLLPYGRAPFVQSPFFEFGQEKAGDLFKPPA